MIKLPKKIAFILLIIVTILLAITFTNIDWNIVNNPGSNYELFKEIREPILFLILVTFYIKYYVRILNNEKK